MASIHRAQTEEQIDCARSLFAEYAASLPVDLCAEDFERECAALPGPYAPPLGDLLLAFVEGQPAGCIALRPLDRETCEMKRVYLRPAFRGRGIGRTLANALVAAACAIRYRRMRLDTHPSMKAAIALYGSLGFRFIEPYRSDPGKELVFMELDLAPPTSISPG